MPTNIKKLNINKIINIFGEKNVISNPNELLSYSTDASMKKGTALLVVLPRTNEQIRKLTRLAMVEKFNLVARGNGTNTQGWTVPNNSVIVDFSCMKRIIELNTKEKTIILEAGVTVNELNNALKKFDLFFPIIPLNPTVSTIGGMIASNSVGYRADKYGTMFNWTVEAEVVDGSGKLYRFKNKKELFGSYGHIGLITKVKLKLTKQPQLVSMDFYVFERLSDLLTVVEDFIGMIGVMNMEYFDKEASKIIGFDEMHTLIIEYDEEQGKLTDIDKIGRILEKKNNVVKKLMLNSNIHIRNARVPIAKIKDVLLWLKKHNLPNFGNISFGNIYTAFSKNQFSLIEQFEKLIFELKKSDDKQNEMSSRAKYGISRKNQTRQRKIELLKSKYDPYNILHYREIHILQ